MPTDFYERGRATGSMIGEMVNPSSTGQEALSIAKAGINTLTELAKQGWGVKDVRDGQVIFDPQAATMYSQSGIPGLQQLAISSYQNTLTKKQTDAEELRIKKIKVFSDTRDTMFKTIADLKKDLPKNPEVQVQYERVIYKEMQNILTGIDPDIFKDPIVRVIGLAQKGLDIKESTNEILQGRLVGLLNFRSEYPAQWNLKMMDTYRTLHGMLSEDSQKIMTSPGDVEKETPPAEIAILSREKMKLDEQMKQGIQTAGAVTRTMAVPTQDIIQFQQETGKKYSPVLFEELQKWRQVKKGAEQMQGIENLTFPEISTKLGMNETALLASLANKIDNPTFNPFGRRGLQASQRILYENAFGKLLESQGINPQQVMVASKDVKSDTKAYITLNTDYERTMQAVEMTKQYAELVHDRNQAYQRTGYPAPNKFYNWAQKNLSSEELAQFEMSLLAFSREYMRVTTGAARTVAELSVGAQAKVDDILSKFDSWKVMDARVAQAEKEIAAVPASYEKRLTGLRTKLEKSFGMKLPSNVVETPELQPEQKGGQVDLKDPLGLRKK